MRVFIYIVPLVLRYCGACTPLNSVAIGIFAPSRVSLSTLR